MQLPPVHGDVPRARAAVPEPPAAGPDTDDAAPAVGLVEPCFLRTGRPRRHQDRRGHHSEGRCERPPQDSPPVRGPPAVPAGGRAVVGGHGLTVYRQAPGWSVARQRSVSSSSRGRSRPYAQHGQRADPAYGGIGPGTVTGARRTVHGKRGRGPGESLGQRGAQTAQSERILSPPAGCCPACLGRPSPSGLRWATGPCPNRAGPSRPPPTLTHLVTLFTAPPRSAGLTPAPSRARAGVAKPATTIDPATMTAAFRDFIVFLSSATRKSPAVIASPPPTSPGRHGNPGRGKPRPAHPNEGMSYPRFASSYERETT